MDRDNPILNIKISRNSFFVAIWLLLCFVFYLYYVFYVHPPWHYIGSDMGGYIERASNLAHGTELKPYDSFYPVGMAYLLAPFFKVWSYAVALKMIGVFYALLLTATNYVIYRFVQDFYHSRVFAWIAFIFSSCYFPFITYLGLYLSEIPFAFFLVLSLYLLIKCFFDTKSGILSALWAGIALGLALIIKGALMAAIPIFMIYLLVLWLRNKKRFTSFWSKASILSLSLILVYAIQISHISVALNKLTFISTNSSQNMYMGQAHLSAVVNMGPTSSYGFANNNVYFDKSLGPEQVLSFDIWRADKFDELTKSLWREDPWRQIKISLNSGLDLFHITHQWPIYDREDLIKVDKASQWLFVVIVDFPVIAFMIYLIWRLITKKQKTFLIKYAEPLSILFIALGSAIFTAMLTKGEPRYLVPFLYLLILIFFGILSQFVSSRDKMNM